MAEMNELKKTMLKTLWYLRFEKLRKTEEDAAWSYQDILDECLVAFGEDSDIVKNLQTLVTEERMHERLADDLLHIIRETHPEISIF